MKTHTCQAFRIKTDSPTWNKEFGEPAVRLGLVGLWTDSVFWGWPLRVFQTVTALLLLRPSDRFGVNYTTALLTGVEKAWSLLIHCWDDPLKPAHYEDLQ